MSQFQRLTGYQLLLKRAQEHKDNPTISEQKLLTALTQDLPDLQFQFQVVMVPFIVDFVSLKKKVIIEVDGKSHIGKLDSDATRQRDLERDGYSFLRFSHSDVMNSLDHVVLEIRKFCSLSQGQRRKYSSPQAEYIQKGMIPRVIGEQNPFAGLHTKAELEAILSDLDPFDSLEEDHVEPQELENKRESVFCSKCNSKILPSEPRNRDRSSLERLIWKHKRCH
jgi:very-short-patch-repair endonuclease